MRPESALNYLDKIEEIAADFTDHIVGRRGPDNEMPASFNDDMFFWGLESIGYLFLDRRLNSFHPVNYYDSRSNTRRLKYSIKHFVDAFLFLRHVDFIWSRYPQFRYTLYIVTVQQLGWVK